MKRILWIAAPVVVLVVLAVGFGSAKFHRPVLTQSAPSVPVTPVRFGDVTFEVNAHGELQGGKTQSLIVPMTGGGSLTLTSLLDNGSRVGADEVVATFDTTEQEYNLREAEADLAEAEQQLIQTDNENLARDEEMRAQIVQAKTDVKVNELECRRNELYARIKVRQNEMTLEGSREKLRLLETTMKNQQATSAAGVALQKAAISKAKVKAEIARRNIDMMTLKATQAGYVSLQQNTDGMLRWGMQVPIFQVGDNVRPGMAVAQIPDMQSWEGAVRIGELDRGHLAEGQPASISVVALPGLKLNGKVKVIGGTTGPPWDRYFDCRVSVDTPVPELRPGMTLLLRIETGKIEKALWIPAQALFESDGRTYVYLNSPKGFVARDVKMVRRSEDKVVITGIQQGDLVAMASPEQSSEGPGAKGGAMQALPK